METTKSVAVQEKSNVPAVFNFFDAGQFETMQRICKMFASSELVPDMYKISPKNTIEKAMANCMIAIEVAQRIGASPLMVMQNMYIVYGKPAWSSKFLIATVNTCGRFNPLQYRFNYTLGKVGKTPNYDASNIDNVECVAFTTAKGSTDELASSPISIKLAIMEGWYTKQGSKWQTITKQMLMYRAASFWTSAYAPELSMGMKTEEEAHDTIDIKYEDVTTRTKEEIESMANKQVLTIDPVDDGTTDNSAPELTTGQSEPPRADSPTPGESDLFQTERKAGF